jgi:hypothetical protein
VPDGDTTPIRVPFSFTAALTITVVATVVSGVLPGLIGTLADANLIAFGG